MLISHTTTCYHRRVPIQVGSHIIDQITSCITEEELQSLSQSLKLAYVSTIISKSSQVGDQEFDLDQVKGKVVTTRKVKFPHFSNSDSKGLTKVMGHHKHVHMLVEPSPKCKSIFVPDNTSELIPGGSGVAVVLRNLSGWDVTLEPHTEVGIVIAANIVPSIQILDEQDLSENEKVLCMSAQVKLFERVQQEDTEDILQKIDLSRIDDCDPNIQQEAQDLIHEYACIFSQNDLDLGKTSIVKHSIKLTDLTMFKEYYRHIPPGMYD